jgi:hypothetical protein
MVSRAKASNECCAMDATHIPCRQNRWADMGSVMDAMTRISALQARAPTSFE